MQCHGIVMSEGAVKAAERSGTCFLTSALAENANDNSSVERQNTR